MHASFSPDGFGLTEDEVAHLGDDRIGRALDRLRLVLSGPNEDFDFYAQEDVLGTFKMVMVGPNRLPITIESWEYATAKLPVGEDIVANTPSGKTVSTRLRLGLANMGQGDTILVKFNGNPQTLTGPIEPLIDTPAGTWFHIDVDPQLVQPGHNLIDVQLTTDRTVENQVALDFLDLLVAYE